VEESHALGGGSNSADIKKIKKREKEKETLVAQVCGRAAARANDIQTYVVKEATGLVSHTCTLP